MSLAAGGRRHDPAPEGRTGSPAATAAAQGESTALWIRVLPTNSPERVIATFSGVISFEPGVGSCAFGFHYQANHAFAGPVSAHSLAAACSSFSASQPHHSVADWRSGDRCCIRKRLNCGAHTRNSNLNVLQSLASIQHRPSPCPATHSLLWQLCFVASRPRAAMLA